MREHFKQIFLEKEEIENKCKELAQWVNETYKDSKDLILIGLLKGSFPFMAQLIKDITIVHDIDFLTIVSFEGGTKSNGAPKIVMDLDTSIENKDVLIIEDIIDSGRTLYKLKEILLQREPKSFKILTLLDKKEGRISNIEADKYGFEIPNVFLAGFGLDVNGKLRNLPYIGEFNKKYLDKY